MMNGTLPTTREDMGVSLRHLAEIAGCTSPAILNKLRGDSPWWLHEAHSITAYLQTFDPTVSLDDLFGLEPLPPSPDLPQLSDEPVDPGDSEPQMVEVR